MVENKVLLVTGASSEIGRMLISEVGAHYAYIWAHYRSQEDIVMNMRNEMSDRLIPIKADFNDMRSTESLIDTIKSSGLFPDHIVHLSAMKPLSMQFHKQNWDKFQGDIDISLRSIVLILQSFIPYMSKQRYGKIVFVLSAYLLGIPPKFQSPYITTKYALLGLMNNLAAEYATKGITVNGVSPDMMETEFLSELPDLIKEQSAKNKPSGKNIQVEEVIPTISYLLSEGADLITGQNIGIMGI